MHYKKVLAGLLTAALCLQGAIPAAAVETDSSRYDTQAVEESAQEEEGAGSESNDIPESDEGREEEALREDTAEVTAEEKHEEEPEEANGSEAGQTHEEVGPAEGAAEEAEEPESKAAEEEKDDGSVPDATKALPAEQDDADEEESAGQAEEQAEVKENSSDEQEEDVIETEKAVEETYAGEADNVSVTILNKDPFTYTGYEVKPLLAVRIGSDTLKEDTDYTVTYENNVDVGTATGHITGMGSYSFDETFTFDIGKHTMEAKDVQTYLNGYEQRYNNHAYGTNTIFVAVGSKILTKGTDYTVSGETDFNNSVSGAEAVVTGIGNCTGSVTVSIPEYDPVTYDIQGSFVYGEPGNVNVTVKAGDKTLVQGKQAGDGDYYVTTKSTSDTMVEVSVNGEYDGAELYEYKTFRVSNRALKDSEVTLSGSQYAYTGSAIKPAVTVTVNGTVLIENTDYTVSYKNNISKGTASVIVTGGGHYTGTVTKTFTIADSTIPADPVITAALSSTEGIVYDGEEKTPALIVKADSTVLTSGTDYMVTYTDNINAGTAAAHVKGKGNYTFEKDVTFTISPKELTDANTSFDFDPTIENILEYANITVTCDGKTLTNESDYSIGASDNITLRTVTVTGKGNYTGKVSKTKETGQQGGTYTLSVSLKDESALVYDGNEKKPAFLVKADADVLADGTDYEVTYENNINAGNAVAHIVGKGNYSFSSDYMFVISPKGLKEMAYSVMLGKTELRYVNCADAPNEVRIIDTARNKDLVEGEDYDLVGGDDFRNDKGNATAVGKGNYTGTILFEIPPYEPMYVHLNNECTYGIPYKPEMTIIMNKGTDKEVVLKQGEKEGEGDFYVKWLIVNTANRDYLSYEVFGSYKGFRIYIDHPGTNVNPFPLTASHVSLSADTAVYTGEEIRPAVTVNANGADGKIVTLKEGTDYDLAYADNTNVGTARVTVTGKGHYTGTAEKTFTIKEKADTVKKITPVVTLSSSTFTYNGKDQKPSVTVKDGSAVLKASDYTVAYPAASVNAGTYKVTVTLKGTYAGSGTASYKITPKKVSPAVTLSKTAFTYNEKTQRPTVTVRDGSSVLKTSDYSLAWSGDGVNAGAYKVTVTLKGSYSGTGTATYKIAPKKITPKVTLSSKSLEYTGKAQKPSVTVKTGGVILPASWYTVTYAKGRKKVGTYKLTVKMKGNYTGEKAVSFKIVPKATKITKFDAVNGELAFIVKWKKQAKQVTGYQVQYSTDKKFKKNVKKMTIKGAKKTSVKLTKGIKSGAYYYVRVRTYKKVGKKTFYSPWKY